MWRALIAGTNKLLIVPGPLKGAGTPSVHSGAKKSKVWPFGDVRATLGQRGLPSEEGLSAHGAEVSTASYRPQCQKGGRAARPGGAAQDQSPFSTASQNGVAWEAPAPCPLATACLWWGLSSHGRLPSTSGGQLAPPPRASTQRDFLWGLSPDVTVGPLLGRVPVQYCWDGVGQGCWRPCYD